MRSILGLAILISTACLADSVPTAAERNSPKTDRVHSERALGVCMPWDYIAPGAQPADGQGAIGPNYEAVEYFVLYEKRKIALPPGDAVQLLKSPKHGTITQYRHPESGIDGWRYLPAGGFIGNDSVEFLVNAKGIPIRVFYLFKVTKLEIDRGEAEGLCKKSQWKISGVEAWPMAGPNTALQGTLRLSAARP